VEQPEERRPGGPAHLGDPLDQDLGRNAFFLGIEHGFERGPRSDAVLQCGEQGGGVVASPRAQDAGDARDHGGVGRAQRPDVGGQGVVAEEIGKHLEGGSAGPTVTEHVEQGPDYARTRRDQAPLQGSRGLVVQIGGLEPLDPAGGLEAVEEPHRSDPPGGNDQ
jgi:hypothetical protein